MANPQTEFYDGTLSGNILVLGSSGSGKTSLLQDIATNTMFGKLEGVYWVSGINLSNKKEGEIESCFEEKVDFYYPSDEYELSKTFSDFENIYRERDQRKSNFEGNGKGELVKRDNLIVLDGVTGLADKSFSFVKFLTVSVNLAIVQFIYFTNLQQAARDGETLCLTRKYSAFFLRVWTL